MFFIASKVLGFVATPSNFIALISLCGLILFLTRWRTLGSRLMAAGIVMLLLGGFSPIGDALLLVLSERFPAWQDDGRAPDGIIILGGAINPKISHARGAVELNAAAERLTVAAELARRYPAARIVFSAGTGNLFDNTSDARFAAALLESFGIARERIVVKDHSRNTADNAALTRDLIQPKPGERWLLVTSAYHMPRSVGVFRKAGFEVDPYPVDWRTRGWIDAVTPFETVGEGLRHTDIAVHEWIGLITYWLTGRSSELWPGPSKASSPRL